MREPWCSRVLPRLLSSAMVAFALAAVGSPPPARAQAASTASAPEAGSLLVPSSETLALWSRGRQALSDRKWDVAVEAWHSLLGALQRPDGESWETLDASTSSAGVAESVRAALRALPEEARAIARERYDDAARRIFETAVISRNEPALLALVRTFPLASCLPDVYRDLAGSAAAARRWERARAWSERCRDEFPSAFRASPEMTAGLALACARLRDAAALEALIADVESARNAAGPSAPPPQIPGPAPGSTVPLLDYCRDLRALATRTDSPPRPWRPGECAPPIGGIGPRLWSWPITVGVDPMGGRLRAAFPGRPGGARLFPYQPVIEGEALWLHGGSSIVRLNATTGEIESTRTLPPSTRIGNFGPDSPDRRAGCVTVSTTPAWIAAVVGLPLLQIGNVRVDGGEPRTARLLWIDRTNDAAITLDAGAGGPLAGSVPSAVPAIAADLPALWQYMAPDPPQDNRAAAPAPWTAFLTALDPQSGTTHLWNSPRMRVSPGSTLASDRGPFERHGLMAVSGSRLFVCDQTALIACLDALTGALLWAYPYAMETKVERAIPESNLKPGDAWEANPILLAEGVVIVTPLNAAHFFALDATTGRRLWANPREKARYLLGVRRGAVFVSGNRVAAYDVRSGKIRWSQPDPTASWEAGGRGLVAEDGLFVPTATGLRVLDTETGETQLLYDWHAARSSSRAVGNLAATGSQLIVAGEEEIFGFRSNARPLPADALTPTLERLFRDLRGDSYSSRETATEELIEIGAAAIPVLERARSDPDPEVVWRAHKILDVIREAQVLVPASEPPPAGGAPPPPR